MAKKIEQKKYTYIRFGHKWLEIFLSENVLLVERLVLLYLHFLICIGFKMQMSFM